MSNSSSNNSSVLIIGGGVIGLCSGHFLAKAGHRVIIVDRDSSRLESCSDRNAGMIVPSHFTPLAAPGVISQGLKWMLNRRSPFFLRPRLDPKLWRWCWQFYRHCNREHVVNSQELLRDLSLESRSLFEQLSAELGFTLVGRGLLMLCRTEEGLREESEVAEAANRIGIEAEVCGPERLRELDAGAEMNAVGGVWFSQDAHLDSEEFLEALRKSIRANGGEFLNAEVDDFVLADGSVERVLLTDGREVSADQYVIAGGAWSPALATRLGLRLPMQGGKGYSFTLTKPTQLPQLCSLLKEGRVAVTPMGETLRVAGTMEICGNDLSIDRVRLGGIVDSFCQFFPKFSPDDFVGLEPWAGLRPCSPDGLPYIGDVPKLDNAIVATGHSMLGLSLGPVSGRMVADLTSGQEHAADSRLSPSRF
jgi:D-amino-acid dehydrogenase